MKRIIQIYISCMFILVIYALSYAQEPKPTAEQIEALFLQAIDYHNAGEYDKAVDFYTNVIELDAAHVDAYWNRARIYAVQEKYDLAITDMRKVNALAPDFGNAYGMLGWYLILQGKFDEARGPSQKVHELAPKVYRWALNLGHTYLLTGDAVTAQTYYERTLRLLPSEEDFKTIIVDFELFVENGWQVEACRQELTWIQQEFDTVYRFHLEANRYWTEAKKLEEQEQYFEAAQLYEKSAEAEQASAKPRREALANELGWAGYWYKQIGQYTKSLESYQQVLEIVRQLGRDADVAAALNNLGVVYEAWGQYEQALDSYQQALAIARQLGRDADIATALNNLAGVYEAWGQYEQALDSYQQALAIARRLGRDASIATYLNNLGGVYEAWGRYEQALDSYRQALAIARQLGRDTDIATVLNNLGGVHLVWGQYEQALDSYQQALAIARRLGEEAGIAIYLNNLGGVYEAWGQYEQALDSYRQALAIARRLGEEASIATALNNLGGVHLVWGQYEQALDSYRQALAIARRLGRDADIAARLNNLGGVYYDQKKYPEAIMHFVESVELKEQLRKTATGDVRRDYLASQISTYQALTSAYVRTGDFSKAFEIIELSRAKLLAEGLAGSDEVKLPSLEGIQNTLPEDTAVLVYANTDWPGLNMVQIIITEEHISALERSIDDFVQEVKDSPAPKIGEREPTAERGLVVEAEEQQEPLTIEGKKTMTFAAIIQEYRTSLQNLTISGRGLRVQEKGPTEATQESLGRQLYEFLLGNVQEHLIGKTHLLIVPDGVLNFIPFEALLDEQGKYLTETYTISYAQSLAVLDLVGQRQYAQDRKPLLAFGGAVYDAPTYEVQMIENDAQLTYLQKQVDMALSQGESVGTLYAQLRGGWSNLPGTLHEVKAIQEVVDGTEILTGGDVNEFAIKELSANGELTKYKVLHFATHGDADPQIPELSALVLSLSPGIADILSASEKPTPNPSQEGNTPPSPSQGGNADRMSAIQEEDGYLRAGEIHQLDIEADFVNLSACETGLGKLYSGEGIVGLTQAFLLAGAKGLSVSLWSVVDESTAQFMVALYKLVENPSTSLRTGEKMSYADAITEVKRRFINGDFGEKWQAPYYWAPFVYYGR